MTTGSKTEGSLTPYQYVYSDVSPTGPWYYAGTALMGNVSSRDWSGGDAPPAVPDPTPVIRHYHVLENVVKDGVIIGTKRVKKSFNVLAYPKRAKRKSPNNYTMTAHRQRLTSDFVDTLNYNYPGSSATWVKDTSIMNVIGPYFPPLAPDANFQIALVNKLGEAMTGSDFNMAVFLAEGHQTVKLIADAAFDLAKMYTYVKKGKVRKAIAILEKRNLFPKRKFVSTRRFAKGRGAVANNWLQLQYGWLPLLSDMKSGAEKLAHYMSTPASRRYTVTKRLSLNQEDADVPVCHRYGTYSNTFRRRIIAYVSEDLSLPALSGMMDPELVAWELLPFSFVADWVLPIGDYLQARALASKLHGTFVTTDFSRQYAGNFAGGDSPYPNKGSSTRRRVICSSGSLVERVTMTRSVSSYIAVPMPNVKPLSKVASWQHCANAIALVVQSFK